MAPASSKYRDLPLEEGARAKARASVSSEAATLLAILSGVAEAFPPHRPLGDTERGMIEIPLQETLYKYGGNLDPAVSLAIALGTVAFIRWQEVRVQEAAAKKAALDRKPSIP